MNFALPPPLRQEGLSECGRVLASLENIFCSGRRVACKSKSIAAGTAASTVIILQATRLPLQLGSIDYDDFSLI